MEKTTTPTPTTPTNPPPELYTKGHHQPNKWRDPLFAILFLLNVLIIIILAMTVGPEPFQENATHNYDEWMYLLLTSCVFSIAFSGILLLVLMTIPSLLIKGALIFCCVSFGLSAIIALMVGGAIHGILSIALCLWMCWYTKRVWKRIPFTTRNVLTACHVIQHNWGLLVISGGVTLLALVWSLLWGLAMAGVQERFGGAGWIIFGLLLSYYWGKEVLENSMHVTVAGTFGTWWFCPEEGTGFYSKGIRDSLRRSLTWSFGSICFGSLVVAVMQALRSMVHQVRQHGNQPLLMCLVECILSCLQHVLDIFTKYAFVFVGLYGYTYMQAGKNVMQLWKHRGWTVIVTDDLVRLVMKLLCVICGMMTAACCIVVESREGWLDQVSERDGRLLASGIGFVVGYALCGIVMSVISSGVNSTIVLFAEAPVEFQQHYPELSLKMRNAWEEAYPGCLDTPS